MKNIALNFSLFKATFCLVYEIVDIMDIRKSLNISIGTVMKNLEMIKFVPDHLKTKKMGKHAVKKLPFRLRYVPDQYQT